MKRTPEQWREYRAKRKAEGRPAKSGSPKLGKFDLCQFIAFDGEGADFEDGSHRYVLLCLAHSDGTGLSIANPSGLSPDACLNFLLDAAARWPKAVMVGFSTTYDTTKILQPLLDEEGVRELWDRSRLRHEDGSKMMTRGRWQFAYQPSKQLYVEDLLSPRRATLWDVFGYFQASFVATLKAWIPADPDLEMITTQKARRGEFSPAEMPELKKYCLAECRLLVSLMHKLHDAMERAGVRVNRWDGAGSIAAALLKARGVKEHKADTPEALELPARCAYFGGRIELLRYGYTDQRIHHYDINSAYPSIMSLLPSLADGCWVHRSDKGSLAGALMPFSLVRIVWALRSDGDTIYPFPYRYPGGHVCYPAEGEGWYWLPEWLAYKAAAHHYKGKAEIVEAYSFEPATEAHPFSWVPELYKLRQEWKRERNPAEYVLKLGLNSLYGKLAQQVGTEIGKPPAWHQLEWAGYITSATRAKLYAAAMQAPRAVIMLATDGVYSTEPLELECPPVKELGLWEYQTHEAGAFVQSGVYWLKEGSTWEIHTRGFSTDFKDKESAKLALSLDRVLSAWSGREAQTMQTMARRVFVSFGAVAAKQQPYSALGCWVQDQKALALYPQGKRYRDSRQAQQARPTERLEDTRAEPNLYTGKCSEPHRLAWQSGVDDRLQGKYLQRERTV